jgi:SpoVK/Ycf46/Vps4 family AAA+-type ATPase
MKPDESIRKATHQPKIDLPGVTRIVKPTASWEQLTHAPDAMRGLKAICQEFKPGQGLMCLFSGARGTAQTLVAQAIAKQLGKPLMHVDLAVVVSKYIGETEKNLNRVLEAAESQDAVLLFDEADALFGKRTEVKDSHDGYANIDTNDLLQRIEAFEGLVILASNIKSAPDSASMRRIRHVIDFPT